MAETECRMPGKKRRPTSDDRPLLHNYVREWRKSRGLNLEKLAEASGLSVSTVSEIERHVQDFTGKTLRNLAEALDTPAASLLAGPPRENSDIWTVWDELGRQGKQSTAAAILKTLRDAQG